MTAQSFLVPANGNSALEEIIETKRREVCYLRHGNIPDRKRRLPISLKTSLCEPGPGFIFECKRRAPSKGEICPNVDLAALAKEYSQFANVISVLTDKTYFEGSFDDLQTIGALTNLPVLAKDFFIDEVQIRHAYAAGADAILLMLSVLGDEEYKTLSKLAELLSLSVLTEVHTEEEMDRATRLGAEIIGINNRDLGTFEIDTSTTKRLARLSSRHAVRVSESGIYQRSQIFDLGRHVNAFLIGSSLMEANPRELKIRELVFGQIKICGLKTPEEAKQAYMAGATFGGVNFVEGTARCVSPRAAKDIMGDTPLRRVGIFRGAPHTYIGEVARALKLDAVQLHGREDNEFREKLRKALPEKVEIWQAVAGIGYHSENTPGFCDRVILDSRVREKFGGTGVSFDWGGLKALKNKDHLGLAGGLNAQNIRAAIKTGIPLLDICSGVENRQGHKTPEKIRTLFQAIREFEGFEI